VALMQAIANGEDPRTDQRSHVFLMAVLRAGTTSCPVRVRNIAVRLRTSSAHVVETGLPERGTVAPVDSRNVTP